MAKKNNNLNLGNLNNKDLNELFRNLNANTVNNKNNLANLNNLVKPDINNTVTTSVEEVVGDSSVIFGNYFLVVAVVVALILVLIIYFFSKTYRVGRTTDTMVLYQSYQSLNSFPFNKAGNVRLGDCRIASAYNCILSGYQMLDYTSEQVLLAVLRSGARYVEFNVFNSQYGDNAVPVVSNGYKQGEWKMTLNDTLLETCFYTLATNAFAVMDSNNGVPNPNDPLFIGLNLNTNSNLACLNKLGKMIIDYFGDRLMDAKYSFQSSDAIPDVQLKNIAGRVVFFASDGFQGSKMEEVINYCWDNIDKNPKHTLQRIYYKDVIEGKITFDDLLDYNKYGLTIIVPHKEGDFWTANYNPSPFLDAGCQFVAMNYQYIDSNIDPYITMFKNQSVVLKPVELRSSKSSIGGGIITSGTMGSGTSTSRTGIKGVSGTGSGSADENAEITITTPYTTTAITTASGPTSSPTSSPTAGPTSEPEPEITRRINTTTSTSPATTRVATETTSPNTTKYVQTPKPTPTPTPSNTILLDRNAYKI